MPVWLPLESNPDIMTRYAASLGCEAAANGHVCFVDVFGLDDELLAMVPQRVEAVMLVFPISDAYCKWASERESSSLLPEGSPSNIGPFFVRQTIGNACGTIGIIHALCNTKAAASSAVKGSFLEKLLCMQGSTPEERAKFLAEDTTVEAAQAAAAQEGQTVAPRVDEPCHLHFVCFIVHGGLLLEMDGRKAGPVVHGKCEPCELLSAAAHVIREIAALDPTNMNLSVMALCFPML